MNSNNLVEKYTNSIVKILTEGAEMGNTDGTILNTIKMTVDSDGTFSELFKGVGKEGITIFLPRDKPFQTLVKENPNLSKGDVRTALRNHILNKMWDPSDFTMNTVTTLEGNCYMVKKVGAKTIEVMGANEKWIKSKMMIKTKGIVIYFFDQVLSPATQCSS